LEKEERVRVREVSKKYEAKKSFRRIQIIENKIEKLFDKENVLKAKTIYNRGLNN